MVSCVSYVNRPEHKPSKLRVPVNKSKADKPFSLRQLPPKINLSRSAFADELVAARVELAELKGYGQMVPNLLLLLSPAVLRESIASSGIENIHTTIFDALQMQLLPEAERRQNDKEVLRYRDALLEGFHMLESAPVCTRVIHRIYSRLLPDKKTGYRQQQNRIINDRTGETIYTPPPAHDVPDLISNWEHFLHRADDSIDPLIKAAIAHYQFEAIHPFSDGNGRCGRILIVLYLVQAGVLHWPNFFISGYLIRHRPEYYRALKNVTENRDWTGFISFMLTGFQQQAGETRELLLATMELVQKFKNRLQEKLPSVYSHELVEALFSTPVTTPARLARDIDIHYRTAGRYLGQMEAVGLLQGQIQGKYHLFFNTQLIELLQSHRSRVPDAKTGAVETIAVAN
jgi:Fic family protein